MQVMFTAESRNPRGAKGLSRLLSCVSRGSTFHDIPQMESLLAGYNLLDPAFVGIWSLFGRKCLWGQLQLRSSFKTRRSFGAGFSPSYRSVFHSSQTHFKKFKQQQTNKQISQSPQAPRPPPPPPPQKKKKIEKKKENYGNWKNGVSIVA